LKKGQIAAYEVKWNAKKKNAVSKAFINSYPNASTHIITPVIASEFLGV
jgi:hypothetical protein